MNINEVNLCCKSSWVESRSMFGFRYFVFFFRCRLASVMESMKKKEPSMGHQRISDLIWKSWFDRDFFFLRHLCLFRFVWTVRERILYQTLDFNFKHLISWPQREAITWFNNKVINTSTLIDSVGCTLSINGLSIENATILDHLLGHEPLLKQKILLVPTVVFHMKWTSWINERTQQKKLK